MSDDGATDWMFQAPAFVPLPISKRLAPLLRVLEIVPGIEAPSFRRIKTQLLLCRALRGVELMVSWYSLL